MFRDRTQAGQLLAIELLEELRGLEQKQQALTTVVVAVPRGGVPVAAEIANILGAPISILVSRKIGAPFDPNIAIGAVSSAGVFVLNEDMEFCTKDLHKYIELQKVQQFEKAKELEKNWLESAGLLGQIDLKGKRVVLVDDGVATGMTALAAVRTLRLQGVAEVILAVPLIAAHAQDRLRAECDLITAVSSLRGFASIGHFYQDFHQLDDEEMLNILRQATKIRLAS